MAELPQLLKRLEAVAVRLEDIAAKGSTASSPAAAIVPSTASSGGPSLEAFNDILNGPFNAFLDLSKKIGGLVGEQVGFKLIINMQVFINKIHSYYCYYYLLLFTVIVNRYERLLLLLVREITGIMLIKFASLLVRPCCWKKHSTLSASF
jgi:hypothetical protein